MTRQTRRQQRHGQENKARYGKNVCHNKCVCVGMARMRHTLQALQARAQAAIALEDGGPAGLVQSLISLLPPLANTGNLPQVFQLSNPNHTLHVAFPSSIPQGSDLPCHLALASHANFVHITIRKCGCFLTRGAGESTTPALFLFVLWPAHCRAPLPPAVLLGTSF